MKPYLLHILWLLLVLPTVGLAQEEYATNQERFYTNLGIRDAQHELSLYNSNAEDEKDFWLDQKAFEQQLQQKDPVGFQQYINGKSSVYREHKIHCGERCDHSDEFARQIAYYIINGSAPTSTEVVLTLDAKKSTPK